MCEYHTKDKAIRHLEITKTCLLRMRYFKPEGLGYSAERAEGIELARLKAEPRIRFPGHLRWETNLPIGAPLPPPPPGYVTTEELTARIQQRNQDPDDQGWGSVEDSKSQATESNLGDITSFLGPLRAVVFFYGGRRRQGDVAHFGRQEVEHVCRKQRGVALPVRASGGWNEEEEEEEKDGRGEGWAGGGGRRESGGSGDKLNTKGEVTYSVK